MTVNQKMFEDYNKTKEYSRDFINSRMDDLAKGIPTLQPFTDAVKEAARMLETQSVEVTHYTDTFPQPENYPSYEDTEHTGIDYDSVIIYLSRIRNINTKEFKVVITTGRINNEGIWYWFDHNWYDTVAELVRVLVLKRDTL